MYYVYVLKCSDNSYYCGITNNLNKRLNEHDTSEIQSYTNRRKPFTLVYVESFVNVNEAIAAEKKIKGWRREKKEALICGKLHL